MYPLNDSRLIKLSVYYRKVGMNNNRSYLHEKSINYVELQ